ncbi:MAG TPA: DegT/DnrJ/EryC1/StrS family aminotransferase [Prolixibacteraceae bacterium]|nr:DegT/DnrJ/EryC1/StrS family aminotransferase [Prolixibacteraceae bacterium]
MNIQMVDLFSQYEKIKTEIDSQIDEVIRSSVFVKGGKVIEFEGNLQKYLNTGHVISCGNGTDALQIALMALNLKEGDEVITTPFTFVSTLEVLSLMKLKPVLADVDPVSFNISPKLINLCITAKTKAIIPVHLYGQCADMESINEIAGKYKLSVIEDACQALGTEYYFRNGETGKAGTIGDIGCNSFFPTKNLGAFGDGGALFTNNDELAQTMRSIANHGMSKRYYYQQIGMNSRLDAIQAAILDVKLKYLDQYVEARQAAAAFYDRELSGIPGITIPARVSYSSHSFHQYTLKVPGRRDELQKYLQAKKIPGMVYYPMPLHLQEAYQYLGYQKGDFPVAEELSEQVLSLPMHTELTDEQLNFIVSEIRNFFS